MEDTSWNPKPCPFCGHTDISVKDKILSVSMGYDSPASQLRRVWAYCRYCQAKGPKRTITTLGDRDKNITTVAFEAWDKREKDSEKEEEVGFCEKYECLCPYLGEGLNAPDERIDLCDYSETRRVAMSKNTLPEGVPEILEGFGCDLNTVSVDCIQTHCEYLSFRNKN